MTFISTCSVGISRDFCAAEDFQNLAIDTSLYKHHPEVFVPVGHSEVELRYRRRKVWRKAGLQREVLTRGRVDRRNPQSKVLARVLLLIEVIEEGIVRVAKQEVQGNDLHCIT